MEQNINILAENFKQNLINLIQQSNLPIVLIKYIIQDLNRTIEQQYYGMLNSLMQSDTINQIDKEKESDISLQD